MKKIYFLLFLCFISTCIFAQNKAEKPKSPIVQALKITPFAPLIGHTSFAYERLIRPKKSIECRLGIIGLGSQKLDDNRGVRFTTGYKFMAFSEKSSGIFALNGLYLEPEISFCRFRDYYNKVVFVNGVRSNEKNFAPISYYTLGLVFGAQEAFENHFLVNFFFGAGYAAVFPSNGNNITTSIYQGNFIPFDVRGGNNKFKNIALKMGLYIGGVWEKERKNNL